MKLFGILRLVVLLDQFTSPVQEKVSCHFIFGIFSSDRSSVTLWCAYIFHKPYFFCKTLPFQFQGRWNPYTAERRDVLCCTSTRTKRFPEGWGTSEGMYIVQPDTTWQCTVINPSLGMYQEIHPCRAMSIYSVKINTSLQMMREWIIWSL